MGDPLTRRYRAAPGLLLRQEATLGAEGWAVDRQLLELPHGLHWTEETDPLVLALVSSCDGAVPLTDQLTILATAHDVEEDALAEVAAPLVAHLVERGFREIGEQGDRRVRALVQTVSRASVTVDGEVVGAIGDGLLILVGVAHD